MATSRKFHLSSSSPDRPLCSPDRPLYTGQHASHIAASLDRSGSFRESMKNPILSSLPNMSRSGSSATQGDVVNFFNYVRFNPKLVAPEHKSNRQTDYKQHISAALGVPPDESPSPSISTKGKQPLPIPEDIKRLRDGLHSSSRRARDRAKLFTEALSGLIEVFPSVTSKKRSRAEGFSNDRSSLTSTDRLVLGPSIGKGGVQGHTVTGGFEHEQQKSEDRTKNTVPNKRTRTSLVDIRMDVRTNSVVRPSGTVDRDKEMLRIAKSGAAQIEERTLSIGGDGWEKSKMKKKRSGIKPEGSPSTSLTKAVNSFQETRQGIQQRHATDARSKLSNGSHSLRPGISNGTVGVVKSDGISQQTGLGLRVSMSRSDPDNTSTSSDRRDCPVSLDKDRVNFRAVNKATDEFNSPSPSSSAKMNTSIRTPRSGSGVTPKLSPVVHRAAVPNDWELPACATKPPSGIGINKPKRAATARSSSPPVVHWQRPQKSSRTARRTNFGPIGSSNDDSPALDSVSDAVGNDVGSLPRQSAGGSPQQIKLKGDSLSSSALSESEESGMSEIKPKEKGRKPEDIDQKAGQNVQKMSNLVLPTRKNKLVSGEEHGDGVRRQGRTGHSFPATRSPMPVNPEKLGKIGTAKQLRSSRLGLEKNESKAGRPPTRKLSDRKAYARQKHTAINGVTDFLVGSEDGHEELLAAVKGVITSARAFSSQFWRQREPFFSLITEEDITYWKQKRNLESSRLMAAAVPSNIDDCEAVVNGFGLIGCNRDVGPDSQRGAGIVSEQLQPAKGDHNVIPLCQRLISALISEECSTENEELKFDARDTEFETEGELELSSLDHHPRANYQFGCRSSDNGYRISGKPQHDETESDIVGIPSTGLNSSLGSSLVGLLDDKLSMPSFTCLDTLDINDKLLLELQSIGIAPEPVPEMLQADGEGICEDITRLEEDYQGQFSKKKGLLDGLLKSVPVTKEILEKDFEHRALDKLVVMAYEKCTTCSSSGGKNSSNKMAKQAALGFVKRTLDRCHQFENTGMSCFSEPLFRNMFFAASSQLSLAHQLVDMEAESAKPFASVLSLEARTASMGSQQSPSQYSQNIDYHDLNSSEQTGGGKEDLWSNRVKKRELSLDDVGGTIGTSSAPSGIGNSLTSSAKGKRSDRDREGKGQSREVISRNGTTKIGRPALSSAKGERKSKTKPRQKATQHSVSVNGLVGKLSEQPRLVSSSFSKSNETSTNSNAKEKGEFDLGELDEHESIDLSNLQLPGMDVLGPDVLDDQGQDLGLWLNIDDDGLQDHDFMGLEIPMDDLADLNMMV